MVPNTSQEHFSTTLAHSTSTQHCFTTLLLYYCVLQSNTPTVRPPKRRQNNVHPVLLRTTKYYYVLQNDLPVLRRTTKDYRSFQNLNFSRNKLPKRAFRARLLQFFKQEASKILRLPRKMRKWPLTLKVWSAKTSIPCETSSTFHTLKERIMSQCVCTAQWREINDAATTTRRRHDQHDANTGPTPDPNYKREPFTTHPGKNSFASNVEKSSIPTSPTHREPKHHSGTTQWSCWCGF